MMWRARCVALEMETEFLRVLMIGDIVGSPGVRLVSDRLSELRRDLNIGFCLINGENAAAGCGLSERLARQLFDAGADVITLGNHAWARQELLASIENLPRLLRPANGPAGWPGQGSVVVPTSSGEVRVISLQGRIFMDPLDDPFATIDRLLAEQPPARFILVDFHAEATSEKLAMAHHLNGRVSLLAGTHTHVQTADERILPGGTAYITDVGMTGPAMGVIGMDPAASLRRIAAKLPARFEPAEGEVTLQGIVVDLDDDSGRAVAIERLRLDGE